MIDRQWRIKMLLISTGIFALLGLGYVMLIALVLS